MTSQISNTSYGDAPATRAQVILTTASDPARWKGRAALLWMRAGRAIFPAPALSASGV